MHTGAEININIINNNLINNTIVEIKILKCIEIKIVIEMIIEIIEGMMVAEIGIEIGIDGDQDLGRYRAIIGIRYRIMETWKKKEIVKKRRSIR
jgi:hypothetical protein